MQTAFDSNPTVDMKGIFLDISNIFDKVWHSELLFRLQGYGFKDKLLALLKA